MWRLFPVLWIAFGAAAALAQENGPELRQDPAKIKTARACGECHVSEYEAWKKTAHATGFKTLHRKETAETIRDRLGLRLIKRDSRCLRCHYTPVEEDGELRAVSGVSCESCHGAARDWINVHNDYGGKGFTYATETPEHRARRIAESRRAGMRRPSDVYPVVTNCFDCHTVPDERLVNVGGHTVGSGDFEVVAEIEKIRHNFLAALRTGGTPVNEESGPERKRLLYVAGRAAALEYALRGVAAASEEGVYLKAMQRRVRLAVSELRPIVRRAELPQIDAMIAAVRGVEVGLGHGDALLAAADAVGTQARALLDGRDGTALASLDPLVLGTAEDEPLEEEEPEIAEGPADEGGVEPGPGAAEPASGAPAASGGGAKATGAVPAVGEFKHKIHPPSKFATLGPGACNKCHNEQNQWWFGDKHYGSAEPFRKQVLDNVRVARLYGLKPSQMIRGDQVCMDCHGSVITGRERRAVIDGVGCESCHGPSAEYKEPHQEGDKALGVNRPGYRKGLELGMRELRDPEVRARTCTGCHYVTEPRLISAGHPSGKDFDFLGGMKKIKHWEGDAAPDALKTAFAAVLAERGPVPRVQLAKLGVAPPPSASGTRPEPERRATPTAIAHQLGPRPRGPAAAGGPVADAPGLAETPARDLDLPPFPEIDESTSIEEVLLLLKERFDLLYDKVYGGDDEP